MITNRVRTLRLLAEMTQEELANAIGVTRQTIVALEKGKYLPSLLLAMNIADVFELPIEEIFYRSSKGEEKKWQNVNK